MLTQIRSPPVGRLVLPLLVFSLASPALYKLLHRHTKGSPDLQPSPHTQAVPPDFSSANEGFTDDATIAANHVENKVDSVVSLPHSDFTHTEFFNAQSAKSVDFCTLQSDNFLGEVTRLVPSLDLSLPVAYHIQDVALLNDNIQTYPVGTGFCSVFLVPQMSVNTSKDYQALPIEGLGPDSIDAEISSADVRLVFTDQPSFHGITAIDPAAPETRTDIAVYSISYILNHPGTYQLSATIELRNYEWSMEDPIKLIFESPQDVDSAQDLSYTVFNDSIIPDSPPIIIQGQPISRPTQPCYYGGHNDLTGRWHRAQAFAANGNQTLLNPGAQLDFANYAQTRDELGWTFAPDHCSLTIFSADDHLSCFQNRSIQFLGDSNLRRLAKSVLSGGNRWCITNTSDTICQCRDGEQDVLLDAAGQSFNISRFHYISDLRSVPADWGYNSRIYLDFIGGLRNPSWGNSWGIYYYGSRTLEEMNVSGQPLNIVAERQVSYGSIDVVVISMIAWDVSAVITPAETLTFMSAFREALLASYPNSTRLIVRLANNVCCGLLARRARFSPPRFQMWNTLWKEFWSKDVREGRVLLDDASVLGGRADVAAAAPCMAPHLLSSHVRIEQMMFMNAVCQKNDGGKARMRDWSDESHLSPPA